MEITERNDRTTGFRWNGGAWFGAQIGGTLWLLVGAGVLVRTPGVAAVWLASFVLANGIGIALWRRRDRIAPHAAMQRLFAVTGACALVAMIAADQAGLLAGSRGIAPSRWAAYTAILVYPLLMLVFFMRERKSRECG
jgi:hypothetical protein